MRLMINKDLARLLQSLSKIEQVKERLISWQGAHISVYSICICTCTYIKVSILTYFSWIYCDFKLWITNMSTLWRWFQGPLFCPLYLGLPRWVPYSINLQMEDRSEYFFTQISIGQNVFDNHFVAKV